MTNLGVGSVWPVVRHVVTFTWKPGTTEEDIELLAEGLAALPEQIEAIAAYTFGPDAGLVEGNCDFALVAEFHDGAGYRAYAAHPAHRELIEERVLPILAARMAVQYIVEPGG